MSQIGTRQHERASECWGLHYNGYEFWPRSEPFAELDPDDYVFPHREIAEHDLLSRAAIKRHCREALCAVFERAWSAEPNNFNKASLERLLTCASLDEALMLGRKVRGDWYVNRARPSVNDHEDIVALEKLYCLLLSDVPYLPHDMSLLIRTAFHAAFNPIVICPAAFSQGELLAVAAWLGLVSRGRRALLPKFVASYWLMLLHEADDWPQTDYEPDAFILNRAAQLFAFEPFKAQCREVVRSGPWFVESNCEKGYARSFTQRLTTFRNFLRSPAAQFGA